MGLLAQTVAPALHVIPNIYFYYEKTGNHVMPSCYEA